MRNVVFTNSSGASVTLNSSGSNYCITSIEGIDTPKVQSITQKVPYQNGVTNIDQLLDPRDISIEGFINVPVDLEKINIARRTLQNVLNPNLGIGEIAYTYNSGTKKIGAKCVACTFANRNMPEPWQRFLIQFECPDPYFRSTTTDSTSVGLVEYLTSFPVEWSDNFQYSTVSSISSRTVTNNGDVPEPIIATVYGPAINPTLINETTGKFIHLVTTIGAGDQIAISTAFGAKSVTLNYGTDRNGMKYLDPQSTFFQLEVGDNLLNVYDDSGFYELRCDIAKTDLFIGI
jgi:hypothetical protein